MNPYRTHNFGHTEDRCFPHQLSKLGEYYYSIRASDHYIIDVNIFVCRKCNAQRFETDYFSTSMRNDLI